MDSMQMDKRLIVTPAELAARYGHDAQRLMDAFNPDGLSESDLELVMSALALC